MTEILWKFTQTIILTVMLEAAQALTDLCQHILNTCTVLNCVTVLKFDILQYKSTSA